MIIGEFNDNRRIAEPIALSIIAEIVAAMNVS
jgi:xanthine/CO dehydrogenase XdhC/CoxF family maturation factor